MNLSPFEHHFIRTFKSHFGDKEVVGQRLFLVAVSGGADSVACASLFAQFQPLFQYEWRIAHVHHGRDKDHKQTQFRNHCLDEVRRLSQMWGVELVTQDPSEAPIGMESEEAFRDFRYKCFNKWQKPGEILVLGHHLDDQLESQMMDLIRGSHFQTWTRFHEYHAGKFRPLSQCDKKDILNYLNQKQLKPIEDPSNADVKRARNWIRHELLSALEARFPGAKRSLSANLKKLYEFEAVSSDPMDEDSACEVLLLQWMFFSYRQKQKFVLNSYLSLAHKSLTQGQIHEVIKQLDQRQKDIRFQTGPIFWMKNAEMIIARREIL